MVSYFVGCDMRAVDKVSSTVILEHMLTMLWPMFSAGGHGFELNFYASKGM